MTQPPRQPRRTWQERQAEEARLAAQRPDGRSHLRARFERHSRGRSGDLAAIIAMFVAGIATTLIILSQQQAALPSWVPAFGEDFFHVEAEFSTAQAVTAGQGQAVDIAAVRVGKIDSVRLEDGVAVVGLDIEPKYASLIRSDASALLRPRTNLQDMVVQLDPGTADEQIAEGATIPVSRTEPNINTDQILARLDGETRDYLRLLLAAGAEGLGDRGEKLSAAFRRFEPFTRFIAELNGEIAKRRRNLARVIHNFRLLSEELARNDDEIRTFISSSSAALSGFANRQADIQQALRELPGALRTARAALDPANELAIASRTALADLIPQAVALKPALQATQRFFDQTADPIGDQIRPFIRQTRPPLAHTAQGAEPLRDTVANFGDAIGSLNYGLNELAFNPGAANPGYLFYLPWLNHNINANYLTEDAGGPFRRGLLLLSCNSARLADGFVLTEPFLHTVSQATNVPTGDEVCPPTP